MKRCAEFPIVPRSCHKMVFYLPIWNSIKWQKGTLTHTIRPENVTFAIFSVYSKINNNKIFLNCWLIQTNQKNYNCLRLLCSKNVCFHLNLIVYYYYIIFFIRLFILFIMLFLPFRHIYLLLNQLSKIKLLIALCLLFGVTRVSSMIALCVRSVWPEAPFQIFISINVNDAVVLIMTKITEWR